MAKKKTKVLDFDRIVDDYEKSFPMIEVLNTEGEIINPDLDPNLSDEDLVELMRRMVWARTYDARVTMLNRQGALGNYAPAGGQEGSMIAPQFALEEGDFFTGTYRDLIPTIFHGLPMLQAFLYYKGHYKANQYAEDLNAYVPQVVVGGHITHAAGVAIGYKKKKKNNVVLSYNGDGATSQGDFYEGLNFAGVYDAPYIAMIQNNGYGISVPVEEQTKAKVLAQKAAAVGIPGVRVDGMDPLAMYAVTEKAREYALAGKGPVLIDAITYRYGPHSMSDDPTRYREDKELSDWEKKDPLIRMRKYLEKKELWTEEQEKEVKEACEKEIKETVAAIGQVEDPKVSELLELMYEEAPQNIQEQIADYKERELSDNE